MRRHCFALFIVLALIAFPKHLFSVTHQPSKPPAPSYLIQDKVKYAWYLYSGYSYSRIVYHGQIKLFDSLLTNPLVNKNFSFGAGASIEFTPHFGFSSEISYERKGVEYKKFTKTLSSSPNLYITSDKNAYIHNSYITVPLMVRFSVGRNVKFFAEAGPYLSFLIRSNTRFDLRGTNVYQGTEVPFHTLYTANTFRAFSKIDHGINLGGGIQIPVHKVKLRPTTYIFAQGRTSFGLGDISQPEEYLTYPVNAPSVSFERQANTFFWQFDLGIRISIF